MGVQEKGGRWFPVKKNGKLYKTGYSSKAKAEAALAKGSAYWASRAGATPPASTPSASSEEELSTTPGFAGEE